MTSRRSLTVVLTVTTVLTATAATASSASSPPPFPSPDPFSSSAAFPTASSAGSERTVAVWEMDEHAGDRTMRDSGGRGLHGQIGDEVGVDTRVDDAVGYRFDRLQPDTPPAHPGHLVTVRDSDELNPGTRDYAVTIRLRTTGQFGNIIQKGQATTDGGSFKMQIPSGVVQCMFRGSSGTIMATTAPQTVNDGRWHTIRCSRTGDGVTLSVDGTAVARRSGWTGRITNSWPLSLGGKASCDQIYVGCDYYAGDLDRVQIDADPHQQDDDSDWDPDPRR